jgi:tryptophanyl-tRNA synthetase
LNAGLEPLRERRAQWEKRPDDVRMIVDEGSKKAAQAAAETMTRVRGALHFAQPSSL